MFGAPFPGGLCQPCICLDIYQPVCGVDGQTYGNGCEAQCNRVEILYEGECNGDCPVETHIRNFEGESYSADQRRRVRVISRERQIGRSEAEVQVDRLLINDDRTAVGVGVRAGSRVGGGVGVFVEWTSGD